MRQTVLIVGLGLIGGSVALALQKSPQNWVIGYDENPDTLQSAKVLGVVHETTNDLQQAIRYVDVCIFATPVNATLHWMEQLKDWELPPNIIISDTGSTKGLIMQKAEELAARGISFIGGHPMAGSHKSGVLAAKPILFENAYYMLTPLAQESDKKVAQLRELLKLTNAKLMVVDAEEHDHMTSIVSHFPHIVAASLVHQLSEENEQNQLTKQLAAGGFRDMTRIAASNPQMWSDILQQNKKHILEQLHRWQAEMRRVETILERDDEAELTAFFAEAKHFRDELPLTQGAMFSTFDLYIDVPDHPGSIAEVTALLAQERISITNIRIVETREDVFGILVVSFTDEEDRKRAAACIESRSPYEYYIA
ncbi:prephenate dehydrogenase [Kurthia massiliensis]|uniref:prephenate dehydrogenase n=1 Tax=Kurthia massiliensis TaxID=1033739 RepID=UPI000289CEC6|nr:prephenate dehydrogenase [Kurthia massiliensis]